MRLGLDACWPPPPPLLLLLLLLACDALLPAWSEGSGSVAASVLSVSGLSDHTLTHGS
jgi:hypothetical protein